MVNMKLLVIYKPDSEYARSVETFVHDFEKRHGSLVRKIEVVNSQSRDAMATMSLYDIMQQPVIMALTDDGQLLQHWTGPDMPLLDDVASYFVSGQ